MIIIITYGLPQKIGNRLRGFLFISSYDTLHSSEDNLWSVILMTGYLTKADAGEEGETVRLKIPNREIASIFENLIDCPVTVLIQIVFFLRPLGFNNYDTAVIIILQEYIRSSRRIFNMFALINVGERSGTGICDVYHIWAENGFKEPSYVETVDPDRIVLNSSCFPRINRKISFHLSTKSLVVVTYTNPVHYTLLYLSFKMIHLPRVDPSLRIYFFSFKERSARSFTNNGVA